MPLIRCSDQCSQTLEEFYTERSVSDADRPIGSSILEIIRRMNETFKETTIYGLTSLYHLELLSQDTYKSPWYVSIISSGADLSYVDYLLPEDNQPWTNARVKGEARSYDELMAYIIIAMTECGGWPECNELKRLYASFKII